ncbi:nitroreductase family protein [Bacteroides sp. AF25-17LB]|uniref:nitroreductase family protein n=1 Tax=unclassified Bacteroides TaxID=2646097 RepID=UPI0026C13669|nr:nitroreductase family protein [Bacteroides sp. AF25-17LB]
MNETLQTIKARRSVRAYMEQQVSAEDLNLILEAATYAPNGMHLETWHFTAIQNKEVLKELNDKIKGAFAKSDDPHTRERGHSQTYCCYYHAPTLVIVSNEPTQWWAAMDCACALENIFLAAKSLGIGSCIIRKSKFPQNPKRSVRFSGKRTKRSVQKRKARNTQKAETKVL